MRDSQICGRCIGPSVLLALALAASSAAFAQAPPTQTAPGEHPFGVWADWQSPVPDNTAFDPHNLEGLWAAPVRTTKGNEMSPFTPLGKQMFDANKPFQACADRSPSSVCAGKIVAIENSNDPMIKCDPLGFPRNVLYEIRHMELVQTPSKAIQLLQYNAAWREIWMDGRKLPADVGKAGGPDPRWYGYSVGRWDGNTFVVNTVGLDDRSWLDAYGAPHSLDLRVEERYTRMDHYKMRFTVQIDDPKIYTKPFMIQPGMTFNLEYFTLPEQICVPSEAGVYDSFAAGAVGKEK